MNGIRAVLKRWREVPEISFLLSRMVWPFYKMANWVVRRVPWMVRVNGGTVDFDGVSLRFPTNVGIAYCSLGWWLGANGYEPTTWKVIKACVRRADVFWDVGSNIGLYAALAKKTKPSLRVEAFEPVPSLAEANRKFQMANRTGVEPRQVAVSSHGNGASIIVRQYADTTEAEPTGSLESGVNLSQGAQASVLSVVTTTLDAVAETLGAGEKLFIKIDVEGHENHVLKGALNLLTSMRPIILCEILPGVSHVDDIAELIIRVRYAMFAICHEGIFRVHPADLGKRRSYTDYLLLPEETVHSAENYFGFEDLPV